MSDVGFQGILNHISKLTGRFPKKQHGQYMLDVNADDNVNILYYFEILGRSNSRFGMYIEVSVENTCSVDGIEKFYTSLSKKKYAVLLADWNMFESHFGCGKQSQYLKLPDDFDDAINRIDRIMQFPIPDSIDHHILSIATSQPVGFGHHKFSVPYYFRMKGDLLSAQTAAKHFYHILDDSPAEQKSYADWLDFIGLPIR